MSTNKVQELRDAACETLWTPATSGIVRLFSTAPFAWRGPEGRFYRNERLVLKELVQPFQYGLMVTGILFATFRISGSKRYLLFRDKYILGKSAEAMKLKDQKQQWKSYFETQEEKQKRVVEELLRLPSDILVSVLCGCSTVILLKDDSKIYNGVASAPLLPGKSLIYEQVCPDVVQAFDEKLDQRVFQLPKNERKSESSRFSFLSDFLSSENDEEVFKALVTLVHNCKARSTFIEQQRQAGVVRPDKVPYPGLTGAPR